MHRTSITASAAAIATFLAAVAAAAAMGTPSPQAVKSAADATRAARTITLQARHGSGVNGTVGLTEIGRTRTRILVRVPHAGKYRLTLHPGTDCAENRTASQADVALTPMNFNTTGASSSATIVSLPLQKVRSNYVLDVRDANDRSALAAACAKLNR